MNMKHEIWTMPSLSHFISSQEETHLCYVECPWDGASDRPSGDFSCCPGLGEQRQLHQSAPRSCPLLWNRSGQRHVLSGAGLTRFGLTVSSWVASARPRRNGSRSRQNEKRVDDRPQSAVQSALLNLKIKKYSITTTHSILIFKKRHNKRWIHSITTNNT